MPIKHKKINIGWVNNKNEKILNFFETKNHCIDAKKLQEISKNKKFYADLDIKENYEFCPVFEQPSISPNKKFNRYESFGKNKLFDIWKQNKASINAWLSIPNSFTAEALGKMGWD